MSALSDKCTEIYQNSRDGQRAVEEFVRKNHPEVLWGWCEACESTEPVQNRTCLVCGSPAKED
jgi:hypothetical protein